MTLIFVIFCLLPFNCDQKHIDVNIKVNEEANEKLKSEQYLMEERIKKRLLEDLVDLNFVNESVNNVTRKPYQNSNNKKTTKKRHENMKEMKSLNKTKRKRRSNDTFELPVVRNYKPNPNDMYFQPNAVVNITNSLTKYVFHLPNDILQTKIFISVSENDSPRNFITIKSDKNRKVTNSGEEDKLSVRKLSRNVASGFTKYVFLLPTAALLPNVSIVVKNSNSTTSLPDTYEDDSERNLKVNKFKHILRNQDFFETIQSSSSVSQRTFLPSNKQNKRNGVKWNDLTIRNQKYTNDMSEYVTEEMGLTPPMRNATLPFIGSNSVPKNKKNKRNFTPKQPSTTATKATSYTKNKHKKLTQKTISKPTRTHKETVYRTVTRKSKQTKNRHNSFRTFKNNVTTHNKKQLQPGTRKLKNVAKQTTSTHSNIKHRRASKVTNKTTKKKNIMQITDVNKNRNKKTNEKNLMKVTRKTKIRNQTRQKHDMQVTRKHKNQKKRKNQRNLIKVTRKTKIRNHTRQKHDMQVTRKHTNQNKRKNRKNLMQVTKKPKYSTNTEKQKNLLHVTRKNKRKFRTNRQKTLLQMTRKQKNTRLDSFQRGMNRKKMKQTKPAPITKKHKRFLNHDKQENSLYSNKKMLENEELDRMILAFFNEKIKNSTKPVKALTLVPRRGQPNRIREPTLVPVTTKHKRSLHDHISGQRSRKHKKQEDNGWIVKMPVYTTRHTTWVPSGNWGYDSVQTTDNSGRFQRNFPFAKKQSKNGKTGIPSKVKPSRKINFPFALHLPLSNNLSWTQNSTSGESLQIDEDKDKHLAFSLHLKL